MFIIWFIYPFRTVPCSKNIASLLGPNSSVKILYACSSSVSSFLPANEIMLSYMSKMGVIILPRMYGNPLYLHCSGQNPIFHTSSVSFDSGLFFRKLRCSSVYSVLDNAFCMCLASISLPLFDNFLHAFKCRILLLFCGFA